MKNSIASLIKAAKTGRCVRRAAVSAGLQLIAMFVFCALLPVHVSANAVVAEQKSGAPKTIVVVGDSLSAAYGIDIEDGWVALIGNRLDAQDIDVEIINASVSGDTSTDGLDKMPGILERHTPDVVIIELGGNDGLRGQPVAAIRRNLEALVTLSKAASAEVVLIGIRLPPNYGPRYVGDFEAVYTELAALHDVSLVPFLLEGVAGDAALMQDDGIHPRAGAQPKIVENVWPVLIKVLTKVTKKAQN